MPQSYKRFNKIPPEEKLTEPISPEQSFPGYYLSCGALKPCKAHTEKNETLPANLSSP